MNTYNSVYKNALYTAYDDAFDAIINNYTLKNNYVITYNDEPTLEVVDKSTFNKWCDGSIKKKIIAAINPDMSIINATSLIYCLKATMNKLNQKMFDVAFKNYVSSDKFKPEDALKTAFEYMSKLDFRCKTKYLTSLTDSIFNKYLQSNEFSRHAIRLNQFEQEYKVKSLTKELSDKKYQIKQYQAKLKDSKAQVKQLVDSQTDIADIFDDIMKSLHVEYLNDKPYISASELTNVIEQKLNEMNYEEKR